jgi:hypothetical protein
LSKIEVYLDEQQIQSLQNILSQSAAGVHMLFDNQLIGEVFKESFDEDEFFEIENIKLVQNDLLKLLQFKTVIEKRGFIQSLKKIDRHRMVRAYFYLIENNLKTQQTLNH